MSHVQNPTSKLENPLPASTSKQEQILQGAIRVFLKEGYARSSMDRVSAEAGVSKQTIYSHFQDKEGLFKALIERLTLTCFQSIFAQKNCMVNQRFCYVKLPKFI